MPICRSRTLAIVVTTYNNPIALETCLLSLERQTCRNFRIYIADDGSEKPTGHLIEKFSTRLPIVHIWHEKNGFRKSMIVNKALAQVREEYVVFIDGDELLHEEFIDDHRLVANKGTMILGTRSNLCGFMTQVLRRRPSVFDIVRLFLVGRITNELRNERTTLRTRFVGFLKAFRFPVPWVRRCNDRAVRGGNMAAWLSDILAVNGFNEAFEGWGFEDTDLAKRIAANGISLRQVLLFATCYHLDHSSYTANPSNRLLCEMGPSARAHKGVDQYK